MWKSLDEYKGKYLVLFFYPLDFTFVCPTEIKALSDAVSEFADPDTEMLGVSTDSKFSHRAWIATAQDQKAYADSTFHYPQTIQRKWLKPMMS